MNITDGDYPANKLSAIRNLSALHGWTMSLWDTGTDIARFARKVRDGTQTIEGRPSWSLLSWVDYFNDDVSTQYFRNAMSRPPYEL